MKTITFYSYKGGVGRSLALSNVANRLSEFGKKVCILDFDLEAPGLHLKFADQIKSPGVQRGIVDYIHEFTEFNHVPTDINDFATPISFQKKHRENIVLIAAGNTKSKEYWKKLSCINWKSLFYVADSQGVDFFYNLKQQIKEQIKPDVLLIDSRTGITDISGVTMSIFADEVVLLAANNKENLEGISQVIKTLAVPSNSIQNKVPKINFVLSRIPYFPEAKDKPRETNAKNAALRIINEELKNADIDNFRLEKILVIHSDQELELKEEFKISYSTGYKKDVSESPIGLDYLELFEEITIDMISEEEKQNFEDFIRLESLIEKAISIPDMPTRIELLNDALEINPKSGFALTELAIAHTRIKSYKKAIDYFDQAAKIDPGTKSAGMVYKAESYYQLRQFDDAINLYLDILQLIPEEPYIHVALGRAYYRKRNYILALEHQTKATELDPESELAWNAYGNTLRVLGRHEEAMNAIYKALEINPQNSAATGTLAEIYLELGNDREFYKNLELAFSFGLSSFDFQNILAIEDVYLPYFHEEKFLALLEKYKIDIDWYLVNQARS